MQNLPVVSQETYIIYNSSTRLYKIGKSVSPEARLRSLECGAGCELKLVGTFPIDIERDLHTTFGSKRKIGEWFNLNSEDIVLLESNGMEPASNNLQGIKNKHGGARPNSGAPQKPKWLKKKQIGLTLPQWLINKMTSLPKSRAIEIENALVEKFGWKPPV